MDVTLIKADAKALPLPDACADLVIGSPPYPMKGKRYAGDPCLARLDVDEWIELMVGVTIEALRVTRGAVLWVVNDTVHKGEHHPAIAGLVWTLYQTGVTCERPMIWHKNAPPNRRDWYGNAYEPVLAFKKQSGPLPYFDWEAIAEPPKHKPGGPFRQRDNNGKRRIANAYVAPKLVRPRDVSYHTVGGGQLGHRLAHANEAPYPTDLADRYVRSLCPPGGTVLDPFGGSGTTAHASIAAGRNAILTDLRDSQLSLALYRLLDVDPGTRFHFTPPAAPATEAAA